jgi:hypothetical protein
VIELDEIVNQELMLQKHEDEQMKIVIIKEAIYYQMVKRYGILLEMFGN